uniref:Exosome complex component CSL4 C-terminal domain-containing protein n=1 Tax=Phaeodactylum tricornutum TaxID=2850 RepID=A0A8J9SMG7_PHATR
MVTPAEGLGPPVARTSVAPTLRYVLGSTVVPGDRLGTIRQIQPGPGTYVRAGHVYASTTGTLSVSSSEAAVAATATATSSTKPTTTTTTTSAPEDALVWAIVQARSSQGPASTTVLTVGRVVLARVVRITRQQAVLEILAADGVTTATATLLHRPEGAIHREDVRDGPSEPIRMQDSFLPGDLVLARVLSLGDSRRYYLTTAEPELGVLHALSRKSGKPMRPTSWKEMACPETGTTEPRKCARPREIP